MNLFAESAEFLVGSLSQVAGRRCLYVRTAGGEQWNLTIIMSTRPYQTLDESDIVTTVQVYDWLIPVADLPVKPRRGDVIEDLDAERTFALAPLPPEPAARLLDSQGIIWLCHSKLLVEANDD